MFSVHDYCLDLVKATWNPSLNSFLTKIFQLKTEFVEFQICLQCRNSCLQCRNQVWFLAWEEPLEKGMASHFSILAWRIPWIEYLGGLQSMGSQRVKHNWATNIFVWTENISSCGEQYGSSLKTNNRATLWPRNLTPGHRSGKGKTLTWKNIYAP